MGKKILTLVLVVISGKAFGSHASYGTISQPDMQARVSTLEQAVGIL